MPATIHPFAGAFAALLLACAGPVAAACAAKSGNSTVALLELYTSEGCNSCPPADRWVGALPNNGFGKNRVVPLAFHVDYWNYLGWVDPFAQSAFTERQRAFARITRSPTVYTPEIVLGGRQYRRWWGGSFESAVQRINRAAPGADIAVELRRSGRTLHVRGEATAKNGTARAGVYVAIYENNLSSHVVAGENSGKKLQHEFVVRRLIGPLALNASGKTRLDQRIELKSEWKPADLGVAVFVQETRGTGILQALALDVCS